MIEAKYDMENIRSFQLPKSDGKSLFSVTPTGSSDDNAKRIDRLNRSFLAEVVILDDVAKSPSGRNLEQLQTKRVADIRAIRDSGDIRAIVRYELAYLNAELTRFAGDEDHKKSLRRGITQLTVVDKKIDHVRDHEAYRLYDSQHVLLKENRVGGLPVDEAQQCFGSHRSRLSNTGKTRMADGERIILEERRKSINRAFELYKGLQREALGLDKAAEKEQGMSLGPEL